MNYTLLPLVPNCWCLNWQLLHHSLKYRTSLVSVVAVAVAVAVVFYLDITFWTCWMLAHGKVPKLSLGLAVGDKSKRIQGLPLWLLFVHTWLATKTNRTEMLFLPSWVAIESWTWAGFPVPLQLPSSPSLDYCSIHPDTSVESYLRQLLKEHYTNWSGKKKRLRS